MSAINRVNEAYAAYHQHADETTLNSLLKATHAYVRLMVWDHAEPDDLAQCVTAHVWTILATYRQESKYSTWLRSVARRSISDYYRQRKAAEEQMPITEDGEPIEPSAEESLNDHPMRDASTLYRLTPDQRLLSSPCSAQAATRTQPQRWGLPRRS